MTRLWPLIPALLGIVGIILFIGGWPRTRSAVGAVLIFVALLWLAGCAPVAQFTYGDASNAAVIDPAGATCYLAIGAAAAAVGEATGDVGILTGIATERALSGALQSPACAPIEAALLAKLLKLTPAAPFVP